MEYPYFTAAQQPYQYMGLPPTPGQTASTHSDEFSNSPSVRVPFPRICSDLTRFQDGFNQYQSFDYNPYAANGLPRAKPPIQQHQPSNGTNNEYEVPPSIQTDETQRGSNSDEDEKDMTPAQSRRKAQNRAA